MNKKLVSLLAIFCGFCALNAADVAEGVSSQNPFDLVPLPDSDSEGSNDEQSVFDDRFEAAQEGSSAGNRDLVSPGVNPFDLVSVPGSEGSRDEQLVAVGTIEADVDGEVYSQNPFASSEEGDSVAVGAVGQDREFDVPLPEAGSFRADVAEGVSSQNPFDLVPLPDSDSEGSNDEQSVFDDRLEAAQDGPSAGNRDLVNPGVNPFDLVSLSDDERLVHDDRFEVPQVAPAATNRYSGNSFASSDDDDPVVGMLVGEGGGFGTLFPGEGDISVGVAREVSLQNSSYLVALPDSDSGSDSEESSDAQLLTAGMPVEQGGEFGTSLPRKGNPEHESNLRDSIRLAEEAAHRGTPLQQLQYSGLSTLVAGGGAYAAERALERAFGLDAKDYKRSTQGEVAYAAALTAVSQWATQQSRLIALAKSSDEKTYRRKNFYRSMLLIASLFGGGDFISRLFSSAKKSEGPTTWSARLSSAAKRSLTALVAMAGASGLSRLGEDDSSGGGEAGSSRAAAVGA